MSVEIGSGRLIPGFEDQLAGVKAGDEKTLNVTFPEDYNVDYLKGKAATFDVKVTEVKSPKQAKADDDFAKSLGLEGVDQLSELLKGQVEQELNALTRTRMQPQQLYQIAATHDFDAPPSPVYAEFSQSEPPTLHTASTQGH